MGKASRRKRQRALGTSLPRPVLPRAPLSVLHEAVVAVGDVFGSNAKCVEAAALLQETGRFLGYQLRVRPVSVIAHHVPADMWVFMGPRATQQLSSGVKESLEDHLPGGKDNGHVILTSEDPCLLLDPNFRQLGARGPEAPSLIVGINSTNPDSGEWHASPGSWEVNYILDEDNRVLIGKFDQVVRRLSSEAEYLAKMLRAGATAETMLRLHVRP